MSYYVENIGQRFLCDHVKVKGQILDFLVNASPP